MLFLDSNTLMFGLMHQLNAIDTYRKLVRETSKDIE